MLTLAEDEIVGIVEVVFLGRDLVQSQIRPGADGSTEKKVSALRHG